MIDIHKLKLKEKIKVLDTSICNIYIDGEVYGIDIWNLRVRVKLNDFECFWYPIKKLKK